MSESFGRTFLKKSKITLDMQPGSIITGIIVDNRLRLESHGHAVEVLKVSFPQDEQFPERSGLFG